MAEFLLDEAGENLNSVDESESSFEEEQFTPGKASISRKRKRILFEDDSDKNSTHSEDDDSGPDSIFSTIFLSQKKLAVKDTGQPKTHNPSSRKNTSRRSVSKAQQPVTNTGKENIRSERISSSNEQIIELLKKNNSLLLNLDCRVKKQDKRLKVVENEIKSKNASAESSGSGTTPKRKKSAKVLVEVRNETRRVYRILLQEDEENFLGWKIEKGITFRDPQNQSVLDRLMQELKGLNQEFLSDDIKEAAYRYYRSCNEEESARRRGKLPMKNKAKRRHERIVRKLLERKSAFEKGTFKDAQEKEKWAKILKMDFMSSDESGDDKGNEVIVSHPLPWLSGSVVQFKKALDDVSMKSKSPQSRREMKERRRGAPSLQPQPEGFPSWVFC